MTRRFLLALTALLALGIALRYFSLDLLRAPIERALGRGLGREVEVGSVHLNLLGAPGFALEDVTIHEDPRAGFEPFAYVESMHASVRWLSLLRRHLDFASISLGGDGTTINLVKTDAGPWNFQFLLNDAGRNAMVPAIKMRKGRVNFKFGDTKSVFYFNHADLDVAPAGGGTVELRFGGEPSRTDRAAQDFGNFFVNGRWTTGPGWRLNFNVDLERSSLDEVSRLIDPRGFGLHGIVALQAELSGAPAQVQVTGQLQVDDVHRWDLLPQRGGWSVPFQGGLDLRADRLELTSTDQPGGSPLALEFRLADFLTAPRWEADARLNQVPLAALVEVARHMGAPFPDTLAAEGGVSGSVSYTQQGGLGGRVELRDASVTLPDAEPLRASSAGLTIVDGSALLEKSTVEIGALLDPKKQSAEVEAAYTLKAPRELDLKITTRGLNIADMRSFGVAAIPLLDQTRQGIWRGWARFQDGQWSGEYELQNARIPVDGLADPLRIQTAFVKLDGTRVIVNGLRAKAGDIALTGEYRWEPDALRPHKFHIAIAEADAAELERLMAPALVRERGFLARTLRLDAAPVPDWLKTRRADGTLSIDVLTVGESKVHVEHARLLWDKTQVRLVGISARIDQEIATGDLDINMAGNSPHYHFDGKVQDVPYKGGKLDLEGTFEADGAGLDLLESAHAEGQLRGRSVAFAPDAEFRTATACFEMQGSRWKLSGVDVMVGTEAYSGTGSSQADGKLLLELTRGGRQVRYSGPLFALAP
jgi:hypothetical protein